MKKFLTHALIATALVGGLSASAPAKADSETLGTLGGAAAGGLIGSQFGHGSGNVAATVGGVVAGGIIGNAIGRGADEDRYGRPVRHYAPAPVYYHPAPVYVRPRPVVYYYDQPRPWHRHYRWYQRTWY